MINITKKSNCCGCGACFNICPKEAISMEYDSEGFLYPKVDNSKCIKCGLCIKICPIINTLQSNLLAEKLIADKLRKAAHNKYENNSTTLFSTQSEKQTTKNKVLEVYGAKNKNVAEQLKSSSGGMFSIFANYVLEQNGIVFGASFDNNWKVSHKYIDKKEDLDSLRRSKYVQSDINTTYKQAKQFLDNNRLVLFTGTPCQIAGLKSFLQIDYENLLAIEIFCHSVPSPLVWEIWVKNNFNINEIKQIDFRDKEIAWDKSLFKIYFKDGSFYPKIPLILRIFKKVLPLKFYNLLRMNLKPKNYRDAFLSSLISRPSCHSCKFKTIEKASDISIGDLWRRDKLVSKMIYDKKGLSIITINSNKGLKYFNLLKDKLVFEKIDFDKLLYANPYFLISVKPHPKREEFFRCIEVLKYGYMETLNNTGLSQKSRESSHNDKNKKLNKLISKLIDTKPLIIKIFRKIVRKLGKNKKDN